MAEELAVRDSLVQADKSGYDWISKRLFRKKENSHIEIR